MPGITDTSKYCDAEGLYEHRLYRIDGNPTAEDWITIDDTSDDEQYVAWLAHDASYLIYNGSGQYAAELDSVTCGFSLRFNNADASGIPQSSLTNRNRVGKSFFVVHEVRDLSMDVDYSGTEGLVGFKAFHFKDILDPCSNEIVLLDGSEVLPANSLVPIIGDYSTNVLTSASFLLG